eukprot:Nk52_evm13s1763 gene=Nk52_evmTU13s1763
MVKMKPKVAPPSSSSQGKDAPSSSHSSSSVASSASIYDSPWLAAPSTGWILLAAITVVSLVTRLTALDIVNKEVFDEPHLGGYSSNYIRGDYHADANPPLVRLFYAHVAQYYYGANGYGPWGQMASFDEVPNWPAMFFRFTTALCGATLPPLGFLIIRAMNFCHVSAFVGAFFLLCGNEFVAGSRVYVLDAYVMCFILSALLCYLKHWRRTVCSTSGEGEKKEGSYTSPWFFWMVGCGIFLALGLGTKQISLMTIALVGLPTAYQCLAMVFSKSAAFVNNVVLTKRHIFPRILALILVPCTLYFLIFYWHLARMPLYCPGVKDIQTSYHFNLEGPTNPFRSQLTSQSKYIANGAIIVLQSDKNRIDEKRCNLYTSSQLRYPNNQNQAVNCEEITNLGAVASAQVKWKVEKVHADPSTEDVDYIRDGDIIRLKHVKTNAYLNSPRLASGPYAHQLEVNTAKTPQSFSSDQWEVVIVQDLEAMSLWPFRRQLKPFASRISLRNVYTGAFLSFPHISDGPKGAPFAVTADGTPAEAVVGSYRPSWSHNWIITYNENKMQVKKEPSEYLLRHMKLSLLHHIADVHKAMSNMNSRYQTHTHFTTSPEEWPSNELGLLYFSEPFRNSSRIIFLLGNPVVRYMTNYAPLVCAVFIALTSILYARNLGHSAFLLRDGQMRQRWIEATWFLCVGYYFHYLPFFAAGRILYIHGFLVAAMFSTLLAGVMLVDGLRCLLVYSYDLLTTLSGRQQTSSDAGNKQRILLVHFAFVCAVCALVLYAFVCFMPSTYGTEMSVEQSRSLMWRDSWLIHNWLVYPSLGTY